MGYENFLKEIVSQISKGGQIRLIDMPDLDLYMDQVTTFINDKLSVYTRHENDKILTKTMINNYTKHNIIPKPVAKKYSKDHLIFLIMIYHLKGIVSIKDMEHLIKPLINNHDSEIEDKINIEDIYSIFQEIQKNEKEKLHTRLNSDIENVKEYLGEIEKQDDPILEMLMLTIVLTVRANMQKHLAERIIDEYFIHKEPPIKSKKNKKPANRPVDKEKKE